ncbi:DNA packaging protein [Marichromatium purpuratum 984]|uniref:DNA packaging protein n=1 Tax=Marichromatium purpuratum 984 TaxID=765910 RepID=W0DXT1_MARPU|nr:terminase gpA endonuclease subunit [Marichromatium purpuratum]AHF03425.1 DNA packaging protein [Marichromatium purpuratum 984]
MPVDRYASAQGISRDVADIIRPPRRVAVSTCAAEVVRIETPGGYSGPWDAQLTPYMAEPMDLLKSRRHEAVVFVSPARTGKTQALLDGWLAHCVTADPGDMGLYFPTQTLAYDYRKRRIERLHRNSPRLRERLSPRKHDTTIEMIAYRNGMILNLGWPTSSQLAQRDLRYVAMTDYDSFPDDIGGEGEPFGLARKRTQVAMSAGMTLVESSPKRELVTNQWTPDGPHAAPPVKGGILPLYNRGDRRRWYWPCLDGCGARFEPPAMPLYDEAETIEASAATAHICCPHCGTRYLPHDKRRLNIAGHWFREGELDGSPRTAAIASYWVLGCAAAFQQWESLVTNALLAQRELEASGDETALRQTTNTDQGMPYMPRAMAESRGAESLAARIEEAERYRVPDGVRLLLAAVDVQGNRFEVCVIGFGIGGERWIVDRYAIRKTAAGEPLQPAVMQEHWSELTDRVINATYRLPDDRELRVYRTGVDLGGYANRAKGADSTARAYAWWRELRRAGLAHRARLVRGDGSRSAQLVRETLPDTSKRHDRKSGSRGDVPVLILNADRIKDRVSADLARDVPGPGYIHLPSWLSRAQRDELTAEQRTPDGWRQIGNRRNETWDLLCYAEALWLHCGGDRIDWARPPAWAEAWTDNTEVVTADQRRALKATHRPGVRRRASQWW